MENSPGDDRRQAGQQPLLRRGLPNFWVIILIFAAIMLGVYYLQNSQTSVISYDFFINQVKDDNVASVQLGDQEAIGTFRSPPDMPPLPGKTE